MSTSSLIIDLESTSLSAAEAELIQHPCVAGILFFSRNFTNREQLCRLVESIRAVRSDLLLMVDQEGGQVQRFKEEFTRLPAPALYGRYYHRDPEGALELIHDTGWLMASEQLSCGIDLSIAPVLDLDLGLTDVVGDRSFNSDPALVSRLSTGWIKGMREAGMASVIKHFPGHGSVNTDSHLALPEDPRTFEEIASRDLLPFKEQIDAGVPAVLPAHILFSSVDDQPSGFSRVWLQEILRGQLGFNGIIISDCLTMEGAASGGGYTERVSKALEAGCQLLILSNRDGVLEVLPWLEKRATEACDLSPLKAGGGVEWSELQSMDRYLSCRDRLDHLFKRFA
ncbi:MAG: beta-N-acetylhexosaminidase [Endozoicomonas sp.]